MVAAGVRARAEGTVRADVAPAPALQVAALRVAATEEATEVAGGVRVKVAGALAVGIGAGDKATSAPAATSVVVEEAVTQESEALGAAPQEVRQEEVATGMDC
eukprot:7386985-Prymnesium_polylepis.1